MLRFLFMIILLVVPAAVQASSWSCTDVESEALLGYDGSLTVVVQGDSNNKTCKFSIDGASTENASAKYPVYWPDHPILGGVYGTQGTIGSDLRKVDINTFAQGSLLRYMFSYLSGLGDNKTKEQALGVISSYADQTGGKLEITGCENGNEVRFEKFTIFCQSFSDSSPENLTEFQRGSVRAILNSAYYVFELQIDDNQGAFFIVFIPSG